MCLNVYTYMNIHIYMLLEQEGEEEEEGIYEFCTLLIISHKICISYINV
jgi:hypothetical protein